MKQFTVTIAGQTRTIPGPDDATQEQAQAEAERQMQASQAADVKRDFSGPGHLLANAAQGAAELVGGPAQLMGFKPGSAYQTAEKQPTTTGDKAARFAGAILPLAPLSAAGLGSVGDATADALNSSGKLPLYLGSAGAIRATAGALPAAIGGAEGAGAPADSPTQRAINTGVGAVGGMIPGLPPKAGEAMDHLIGTGVGGIMGHGVGGPLSGLASIWGARLGNQMSHYAPIGTYARALLSRFPPSVVGRMLADAGYPVSKILGQEYDYLGRTPGGDQGN
jgi:hypothetical protein